MARRSGAGLESDIQTQKRRLLDRELTCESVVRDELENILRYNPRLNAFITVFDGESQPALSGARQIDGRPRRQGREDQGLRGIPLMVKDNFFTAGWKTTNACVAFRDFIPAFSSSLLESLAAAGGVLLGKTNMHELALGATSASSFFGPVRNPSDDDRVSGGSSGGTAVAVAMSKTPAIGLGSDTGGSVRVPAALCGVCGFKPSIGRLSTIGIFPLGATLDHAGFMTKTVADMVSAAAVSGIPQSPRRGSRRVRVGIPAKHFSADMDGLVSRSFWRAVDRVRGLFGTWLSEDASLPDAGTTTSTRTTIQFREAAWLYEEILVKQEFRKGMHPDVLGYLVKGSKIGMLRYMHANLARAEFIGKMNLIFKRFDLLLMPTCLIVAPRLEETSGEGAARIRPLLLRNTEPFNLCGFPALTLPIHRGNDLPVGLQIAGRFGEDSEVLTAGRAIEDALR